MEKQISRPVAIILGVVIALVSYLVTAYFINTWPFDNPNDPSLQDLFKKSGSDKGSIEDLFPGGNENYLTSDGKESDFGDFVITFPQKWLILKLKERETVTAFDSMEPLTSGTVLTVTDDQIPKKGDKIDPEAVKEKILSSIEGGDFNYISSEKVTFLERECVLFSGTSKRIDQKVGMFVLIVPNTSTGYIIMGTFSFDDDKAKKQVEEIISSFRVK
jgi:hypothetical protein